MDEPLSNLDAKLRVQMRAEISQVQHDLNVTTLYVTHDQIEAMTMGDRVAVIKGGILQQVGPPQFLYDNPANIFVAGFIGSPPMNLGMGTVIRRGDGLGLQFGASDPRPASRLSSRIIRHWPTGWTGTSPSASAARTWRMPTWSSGGAPEDSTLDATVGLTEALGSEIVVHFDLDVPEGRHGGHQAAGARLGGRRHRSVTPTPPGSSPPSPRAPEVRFDEKIRVVGRHRTAALLRPRIRVSPSATERREDAQSRAPVRWTRRQRGSNGSI